MTVKRFAIQHPYSVKAENQSAARIVAAAERMGIEAQEIRDSHDIMAFNPDFVLSISHQDPKLTPFPTYGVMTAPSDWYEVPRFIRNILSYDAYLTVAPSMKEWLEDLTFGARKINAPVGFFFNTVLPYTGEIPINDFSDPALVYIGSNWDGGRHSKLFELLTQNKFLKLHGPEKAWEAYPERYAGPLAFDDVSVLEAYRTAGIGLCIEHTAFIKESMPSNRIFETLAAGALAICARTEFNQHWFGDSVLYLDMDLPAGALAQQIADHMNWIRKNPEKAADMTHRAHQVYCENFALNTLLENLFSFHEQVSATKGYSLPGTPVEEPHKVGVIIRAGSRGPEFLHRSIGSVARQTYRKVKVFLILWKDPPGLDDVLAAYPELELEKLEVPGGNRSACQWAGLRAAKEDGCDLIGVLDDDDEYHPNMVYALLDGYRYHQRLSFQMPITMVAGGSLVAHATPLMNYTKFETENALPRPETRYIQHFHFGNAGQVNDRSYGYSPCSLFFVASFLDEEILQNPNMNIVEDWMIWLQMAERGRTVFIPEVVSTVYEHDVDRSGYKGKTEATFRNHAKIARRMFSRRFSQVEHYEAPGWLKHQYSDRLMATWISNPPLSERPEAEIKTPVSDAILSDGAEISLPAGYCEFQLFLKSNATELQQGAVLNVQTKCRSISLKIDHFDHDISGYAIGKIKFFITDNEAGTPVRLNLEFEDAPLQHSYLDSQVRQMAESHNLAYVKFGHLLSYDKIWLYGASKLGDMALNILSTEGLTPAGVADTYQTGTWKGLEILSPDALKSTLGNNDVIVISSEFWWEISNDLIERGINNHMFVIKEQSALATIFDA